MSLLKTTGKAALTVSLAVLAAGAPAMAAPDAVGQVISSRVEIDGVTYSSGATVFSPSQLRAGSEPAFVHLDLGYEVELDPGAVATFEREPGRSDGAIRLTADTGSVSYSYSREEVSVLTEGNTVLLTARDDGAAWLSPPVRKAVIAASAVAVGGLIYVIVDDDEERPASPITP